MSTADATAQRVASLRDLAAAHPNGIIDCNIGTPCDPVPNFVKAAVSDAVGASGPYPLSAGSPAYRGAGAEWMNRRFGLAVEPEAVAACVGTKEFVASLPQYLNMLGRRNGAAGRDTVLYPAIAYPTYAFGAQFAGCRAVAVPLDQHWQLDLNAISEADARRATVLWINVPGNPTSATASVEVLRAAAEWGRAHGVIVVSDECYVEFAPDAHSILECGSDGVLALHSLSKRSNFAGMRNGLYAGDPALVQQLVQLRREAGLIVPTPAQAAAVAAWSDDEHVGEQRARYERRRAFVLDRLAAHGIEHVGGSMPFYIWLSVTDEAADRFNARDGFDLAARFAEVGWLTAPGATFGTTGTPYVRIAMVQPDDVLLTALDRFDACFAAR